MAVVSTAWSADSIAAEEASRFSRDGAELSKSRGITTQSVSFVLAQGCAYCLFWVFFLFI